MKKITCAIFLVISLLIINGCSSNLISNSFFTPKSASEKYLQGLQISGLSKSILVQKWKAAKLSARQAPNPIPLPYKFRFVATAQNPVAHSYSFKALEGQILSIRIKTKNALEAGLFVELYQLKNDTLDYSPISFADSSDKNDFIFQYQTTKTGDLALLIQPELLWAGIVEVSIESQAAYKFPVQGYSPKDIGSFYGFDRDAGLRKHEGIDIFAPRNTPVLASADARVSFLETNKLGGIVVWLQLINKPYGFYYAHLDSRAVITDQIVKAGDTIGFVGNSGNAISTEPHLHFGIYANDRKAIDPLYFIKNASISANTLDIASPPLDFVRLGYSIDAPSGKTFFRKTAFKVLYAAPNGYYVKSQAKKPLFVNQAKLAVSQKKPLGTLQLKEGKNIVLYQESLADSEPVYEAVGPAKIKILGNAGEFRLVEIGSQTGFVYRSDLVNED